MLTYHKSTLGVLHMQMYLSLGHMTATRGICPSEIFLQIGLRVPGGCTLGFAPNF